MKKLALLLLTVYSFSFPLVYGEELTRCYHAIANHARDAIAHNESVKPIYSELSNGKSEYLSSLLIFAERLVILNVVNLERESHIYQQAGIPLLCDDLASMHDLPPFQKSLPEELRPREYFDFDYKETSHKIKNALKEKNYDEAYATIGAAIVELESHPNQQCMSRHFLESMARSLMLAKTRQEEAKALGLPDPMPLIEKFVNQQRITLGGVHFLDKKAFPLQQQGIAIFCQDVPAIPWK